MSLLHSPRGSEVIMERSRPQTRILAVGGGDDERGRDRGCGPGEGGPGTRLMSEGI